MAGGSNEPLTLVNIIKLRKLKKLGKGITLPELFIQFGKYSALCKSLSTSPILNGQGTLQ